MAPLPVDILRSSLAALSLDTRGHRSVLAKRLAKSRIVTPPKPIPSTRPEGQHYDSYLVFDVEATCERIEGPYNKLAFAYPNEIIEWPVIYLKWRRVDAVKAVPKDAEGLDEDSGGEEVDQEWALEVVDEYHSYVKPRWRPSLSAFCTDLTGITQEQVDAAPSYPDLLKHFEVNFLHKHDLFSRYNKTVWVTDGPWDLRDFIAKASHIANIQRPHWLAGTIIDLRLSSATFFSSPSTSPPSSTLALPSSPSNSSLRAPPSLSLPFVLESLALEPFIGRLHSGLSDARNAARILVELARRGQVLVGNRVVPEGGKGGRERRWGWMTSGGGVGWDEWVARERVKMGVGDDLARGEWRKSHESGWSDAGVKSS